MSNDLIYVASPFSHKSLKVEWERFYKVCEFAYGLIEHGHNVFCPIAHSVSIEDGGEEYLGHDTWMKLDKAQLKDAAVLVVYTLPGWEESRGVREESQFAEENNIPIVYFGPGNPIEIVISDLYAVLFKNVVAQ